MDNSNFLVGKFRPITDDICDAGGDWLGDKYYESIDEKPFTVKTMKEGIKAQQRIWTNLKIKKSDEQLEKVQNALTPEQKMQIRIHRRKLLQGEEKSWDDLIDAMDITD